MSVHGFKNRPGLTSVQIFFFCLLFCAFAFSPCYMQKTSSNKSQKTARDQLTKETAPPPFQFSYNVKDGNGTTIYHEAQGDKSGKISGSYGYSLANGLYRRVMYVADSSGYRPVIQTNEPGTGKNNPADVIMDVKPVPESVARSISSQSGTQNARDTQRPIPGSTKGVTGGVTANNMGSLHRRAYGGYRRPIGSRSSHTALGTTGRDTG